MVGLVWFPGYMGWECRKVYMVGNKRANVDVHEGRSFAQCVSLVKLIRTYRNLYGIILYNDQTSPGTVRSMAQVGRENLLWHAAITNYFLASPQINSQLRMVFQYTTK